MENTAKQIQVNKPYFNKLFFLEDGEKNILLIDDDPSFRSLMEMMSMPSQLRITALGSLHNLSTPKQLRNYDAIIMDYYLDHQNGLELSQYISAFFPSIPIILISGKSVQSTNEKWPDSIKSFCSKKMGVEQILKETQEVLLASKD